MCYLKHMCVLSKNVLKNVNQTKPGIFQHIFKKEHMCEFFLLLHNVLYLVHQHQDWKQRICGNDGW